MPDLSTYLRQQSLTYSDVVTDLTQYVESLPSGSKPKDLFQGSEGKLIIDYLAAEHSDIAYKIIMGFCESYLLYANKIENIIANAESKGYNVGRGSNATFKITFTARTDISSIGYLEEVGTIQDYSIYSLDSLEGIQAGEQVAINVVIGNRLEATYNVANPNQLVYRFTVPNVSDDIRVYIDTLDKPVNHTDNPVEALYGRLCAMTNSYGSIDILDFTNIEVAKDYIIKPDYEIKQGSVITLQYIERANVKYEGAIGTFLLGSIISVVQTSTGVASEAPVEIQKNAIIYQQTQNRVVARRDYKKVTQLHLKNSVLNTNDTDYSPATVAVTYVKKDGLPMTDTEYKSLMTYLQQARVAGIPLPVVIGSNAVNVKLNAQVSLSSSVDADVLTSKIQKECQSYMYVPGAEIDFNELEESCEVLEAIRVTRFSFNPVQFPANQYCQLGTVIQPDDGNAYIAVAYVCITGEEEPEWPSPSEGDSENLENSNTSEIVENQDNVTDQESGGLEPDDQEPSDEGDEGSDDGDDGDDESGGDDSDAESLPDGYVQDGSVIWKAIHFEDAKYWQPGTIVNQGQIYLPVNSNGYAYEAQPPTYKSGTETPIGEGWDADVYWSAVAYDSQAPQWQPDTKYVYGDIVNIPDNVDRSFTVSAVRLKAPDDEPLWDALSDYTVAGNIMFKRVPLEGTVIAKDAMLVLPWNSYLVADISVI